MAQANSTVGGTRLAPRGQHDERPLREATVTFGHTDLDGTCIGDIVSIGSRAGLRVFDALQCDPHGSAVQIVVQRPIEPCQLESIECVADWTLVVAGEHGHVYLLYVQSETIPSSIAARVDELLNTCDATVTDRGLAVRLVGPQAAIAQAVEQFETVGYSPQLDRLGEFTGRTSHLDELTRRQLEVLQLAHEKGYYEVPRRASTGELAMALDLDASTVSEHLQRAERNLLRRLLQNTGTSITRGPPG